MNALLKPYIGVTGFYSGEQVALMAGLFQRIRKADSDLLLHVGAMTSFRILRGLSSRFAKAFPPTNALKDIFGERHKHTYNCLHWVDYKNITQPSDLAEAVRICGPNLDAIQLDMTWPDPVMIEKALTLSQRRDLEVILQVRVPTQPQDSKSVKVLIDNLRKYGDTIDRILLDISLGKGVPINPKVFLVCIEAIKKQLNDLGIVVAGGLGPGQTGLIEPIIVAHPKVSIDAESRLRPSGNNMDPLDLTLTAKYLREFVPVLE